MTRSRVARGRLAAVDGSTIPALVVILVGIVLTTGIILRVGSAAFVKDKAQTAADAAALAFVAGGGLQEAERVAYLNGARVTGSAQQGRAVVVEVVTFKKIFGRANIPGRARAAAIEGTVTTTSPTGAPPPLNVDPVFGPCPVSTTDWRTFARPIDGRATQADLRRLPAFLRSHGFEVRDDEAFCRGTRGNESLVGAGARLGALGFSIRYDNKFPTESFRFSIAEGDDFEQVQTLDSRNGPRLVPLEENLGDRTQ